MSRIIAVALLAAMGATAAQETKPPAQPEPSAAPKPAPRLKLKLDNPASYAREEPREASKDPAAGLPALGGGSGTFERNVRPESERVYPKDATPGR